MRVACGGVYAVDARYANGSGPIGTDAGAAIRTRGWTGATRACW